MCCKLFGIPSGTPFDTANLQHYAIALLYCNNCCFLLESHFIKRRNPGMAIFSRSELMWYQTEAVVTQISKIASQSIHWRIKGMVS